MPTELDSLQLNVTASTSGANTSIDNLIKKLNSLSQAIGAVNSAGFVTSMENMASAMNEIKIASDNTNAGNLKSIADGIKTLANSTKGLSDGSTVKTFFQNLAQGMATLQNVNATDYSGITSLFNSISKMGSGNVTNAGVALPKIAEALRQFQGIALPDFAGMESFTMFLRSLGSKTIVNAASALLPIVNALREFETLNITNIAGIAELAQSLSMFGRASTQKAVTIIPQVANAFRDLITTLASAPAISRNVIDLANALAQFVANVNRVGNGTKNASNWLNIFGQTAGKVSKKTFSLASAIGKLYATYFLLFRAFHLIKKSIDISSNLKEVQNVVDTTFGDMTDKVEEFASTSIESFGMSELSAKRYASRFQAMGVAMGITSKQVEKAQQKLNSINPELANRGYDDTADSMADMSINITKLAADMASFYNVAQEDVAKDLESIWTGQTRPLRAYGLDLTNATLQEWAMKNGIEGNVKAMSQAQKTLLRYQYVLANTSAAQGDFTKTNLTWANQVRILAQNFERLGKVIGEGFIAWLRPVVVTINSYMDSIIASFQRVINAFGQIFGWQMIVDTTGGSLADDAEDIADGYDDATESAKKFKQQLLGIDELNNLTSKSGSGDGDDSGAGGLGGTNIVNPGGISFVPYESEIKNLYDLGKKFSEGLKNLFPDNWDEIYEKARNFGKGLADFLNGLIQPDTFRELGISIAGAIITAVTAVQEFATDADWEQWGESISEGINGFFAEFDGGKLADSINKLADGIWQLLKKAVKNIDWSDVFADMLDFLSTIKLSTVALWIGAITIKGVGKWVFGGGLLKVLGSGVAKLFGKLKLGSLFSGLFKGASLTSILKGAGVLAGKIVAVIAAAIGGFDLGTHISKWLMGENAPDMSTFDIFKELIDGIIQGDLWGAIGDWFSDLVDGIGTVLSDAFTWLWEGIESIWSVVATWFDENVIQPLVNFFEPAVSRISAFFEGCWIIIQAVWKIVSEWFDENVIKPVSNFFSGLWEGIKSAAEGAWNWISGVWENVSTWFDENIIKPVAKIFEGLWDGICSAADWAWNSVLVPLWEGAVDFFDKYIVQPIGAIFEGLWDGIQTGFKGVANFIIGMFEKVINGMIDAVNWFIEGFSNIVEWAGDIIGQEWGGIEPLERVQIPRFENGGFPDQGSLFVAGETYGKTEWVGNINGRTGVASGNEITGIADAIYSTSQDEMELLRQQNQYLYEIMNKEFGITRNQIGKEAQGYAREYFKQTGRQAFQV